MKKTKLFLGITILCLISLVSCTQQKPEKTIKNLKDAIIGETTASAKYKAFAEKARAEGNDTIAVLFDAASKAEAIHADNHTQVLTELGEKMDAFTPKFEVKTTLENLQAAIEGESYEAATMYPQFIKDSKNEKVERATKSFTWALDTEKKHDDFYTKALNILKTGSEQNLPVGYAVCPVCGNTYDVANIDNKCAFCQTDKQEFLQFK